MKRQAILVDISIHKTTFIMVDSQNAKELLPYLMQEGVDAEFKEIRSLLKDNLRNSEKYRRADFSEKARNVFEMRFTRNTRNDRIYCQEIRITGKRFIVMAELFLFKKSQEIPKRIKSRIQTIGGNDYELVY